MKPLNKDELTKSIEPVVKDAKAADASAEFSFIDKSDVEKSTEQAGLRAPQDTRWAVEEDDYFDNMPI